MHQYTIQVNPEIDKLTIDGTPIELKDYLYIALNKPPGFVSTAADEKGRQTVADLLPKKLRYLRSAGRLDMYSEGLLIFTNNGELIQKLTHPANTVPKKYSVIVKGYLKNKDLKHLAEGVALEDGVTKAAYVNLLYRDNLSSQFEIILKEGRNRQIRRMCTYLGYPVLRLIRLAIGRLQLGEMALGSWRYLNPNQVKLLLMREP